MHPEGRRGDRGAPPEEERLTLFRSGPFSQWHPAPFVLDGTPYPTAEHAMMAARAALFGDAEARAAILAAPTPRVAKALGRAVRGYDDAAWRAVARDVAYRANRAKFEARAALRAALLATAGTTLVEASPSDTVWGIGLAADHPDALDRARWRGTNWLGDALTRVRDDLLAAAAARRAALDPPARDGL